MSRSELLVPDGWTPTRGGRVVVLATKTDPEPPVGVFRLLEKAPGGWWAQPADEAAHTWAAEHPGDVTQGCIEVPGRRLVPPESAPRAGGRR